MPWLAVAVLCAVLFPDARARADDWLAVLPACEDAAAQGGVPAFELIYPRPGLPALVEAGEMLIVRVRLPSPLTPPPGVQQRRALRDWSAELVGHALGAGGSPELAQRYPLEVVNVRPDGAASLIYRASLPIPAWAAPGTYDLVLSAPGGHGRVPSLVRVLARGQTPRMAWVAQDALPEGAAIAALPIDVWVRADVAPLATAQAGIAPNPIARVDFGQDAARAPLLDPRGQSAALRVGAALWVLGGCHSPHLRFEDEVASVLANERRTQLSVATPQAPAQPGFAPWGAWFEAWPAPDALRIERVGEEWRATLVGAANPFEIALVLQPDERAIEASAGELRFYPASEIASATDSARETDRASETDLETPPALVATWILPGTVSAVLRRVPASGAFAVRLMTYPRELQSGELVHARVAGAAHAPRTAYRFDAQRTAFGPSAVEHVYTALGVHAVDALAISADGRISRLEAKVRVGTAQRSGCHCQLVAARHAVPRWAWLGSLALVLDLRRSCVRRRRARATKARSSATPE